MIRNRCTDTAPCTFHEDNADEPDVVSLRCPYYCDTPGCDNEAEHEADDDRQLCVACFAKYAIAQTAPKATEPIHVVDGSACIQDAVLALCLALAGADDDTPATAKKLRTGALRALAHLMELGA